LNTRIYTFFTITFDLPLRQRRAAGPADAATSTSSSSYTISTSDGSDVHNSNGDNNSNNMSFEQLKREAVNLERQLEDKVSRYQQVRRFFKETVFCLFFASVLLSPILRKSKRFHHSLTYIFTYQK
jgi:hypothetical protein